MNAIANIDSEAVAIIVAEVIAKLNATTAPKAPKTTAKAEPKTAPKAPKVRRVRGRSNLAFGEKKVSSLKVGAKFRIRPEGADYTAKSVKTDKAHGFAVVTTDHPKAPSIKLRLAQTIYVA